MPAATKDVVIFARAVSYLLYAFVIAALVILTLGFILLLFGANPDAAFAEWVYRGLDRVMEPFRGIFEAVQLNSGSVLDTSVLFAMVVYGIFGLVLSSFINWLRERQYALKVAAAERQETQQQGTYPPQYPAPDPAPYPPQAQDPAPYPPQDPGATPPRSQPPA